MNITIEAIIERHLNIQRDALLPLLQEIQDEIGYLSEEAIIKVGESLHLATSKIYGVATFYDQFRFEPCGRFHLKVCRGTACHIMGSATVLAEMEKQLKIKSGQTSRDGLFSLDIVRCMGACALGPVISVNSEFYPAVTILDIARIIEQCKRNVS
ncbi:MAG: NADH-quinone oxidoreductase subunit NuoE [Bacteroidales bacterium]